MTFRDTLFTIPGLWWVLIGQSGLSSLVQQLDKRVSDRLIGPGLELKPLSAEELDQAINLRVTRFHESLAGKAPLTKEIHRRLYDVSQGEIRFVFKYSHSICVQFVSNIRKVISDKKIKLSDEILNRAIGDAMIKDQISVPYVGSILRDIIQSDVEGLQLRHKDKAVLKKIGEKNGARAKDYAEYGLKSGQDFSSNYLTRFYESNLLFRIQEGRSVVYKLRGIALLASGYGFID
jgi:hypothetical protein